CLLSAQLRPGNASARAGLADELKRLLSILQRHFPKSQISYRADAGSASPEIYTTLESLGVLYAIGIASNAVFQRKTERWLSKAQRKYARTHKLVRVFYTFDHR
ncbi:MAG: transposase, partial [Candidatus Latescibacteria bacterium]|nr:transposase [Candidatus Latescibacterota bacterium]